MLGINCVGHAACMELEAALMSIVSGLDVHRTQITFDYLDTVSGVVQCGQIVAADRRQLGADFAE